MLQQYAGLYQDYANQKDNKLIVVVCTEAAKAVIGKSGETINKLRDDTGCSISVSPNKVDLGNSVYEQSVQISGTIDGITAAVYRINEIVQSFRDQSWYSWVFRFRRWIK